MDRRTEILDSAAELFARRGFHGVSVADLGKALGISGPALYKHFPSKDAILAEMLTSISDRLLDEGRRRIADSSDNHAAIAGLIDWHIEFALEHRALIIVQDRDWSSLPDQAREYVRAVQRDYVALWAEQLQAYDSGLGIDAATARAHALFGLLNSTPHSALLPDEPMAAVLREMAERAVGLD